MDVSQEVIVREDDCFESRGEKVRGISVAELMSGKQSIESLEDRLRGRTAAEDIIDPATGAFPEGGVKEQTRQSLTNAKAILEAAGLSLANVVKTTVFLADMGDFAAFNGVYARFFTGDCPARSCVAVKTLPKGVMVEVEAIAEAQ